MRRQFVSQYDLGGFTHLADDRGTVWRHFGVAEQEFFVVLDRAGVVVHKVPLSTGDLRQRLAAVIRALTLTGAVALGFVAVFGTFGLLTAPVADFAARTRPG